MDFPKPLARRLAQLLCVGAATTVLLATTSSPAAAEEEAFGYMDGVYIGAGFNPERAQVFSSPLTATFRNSASRISTGEPAFSDDLISAQDYKHSQSGAQFDLSLEARYLAFYGRATASFSERNERSTRDFYLASRVSRDFGRYELPNTALALTPEAETLRKRGYVRFRSRYGTHCIFAEYRHAYLTATYTIRQMSDEMARQAGATWDAQYGGFQFSGGLSQKLESAAKTSSVSVKINGLGGLNIEEIIKKPDDIVRVQQIIEGLGASLIAKNPTGAYVVEPVMYRFVAVPWEELLTFPTGGSYQERLDDFFYQKLIERWSQARQVEGRLMDALEEATYGYYSYLSPSKIQDLESTLQFARARIDDIEKRLIRWTNRQETPSDINFTPTNIQVDERALRPIVERLYSTSYGGPADYYYMEFRLVGGNRFFSVRARNLVDGAQFVPEQTEQPFAYLNRPLSVETETSMVGALLIRRGLADDFIHEWLFEVLNRNGDVVATYRMPRTN